MLTGTAGLQEDTAANSPSEPSDPGGRWMALVRVLGPLVLACSDLRVAADVDPWPFTPIRREEHPWRISLVSVSASESSSID